MRHQKKAVRPVHIVARYFILKNHGKYHVGDVVLLVRNDKNVQYLVTITPTEDHSCSCPSHNGCYHLTYCVGVEEAREAAAEKELAAIENARKGASEKELAMIALTKEVEAMVVEAEKELAREVAPARDLAPLNNRNRGFSLLRR